jgi:hypothetical protein
VVRTGTDTWKLLKRTLFFSVDLDNTITHLPASLFFRVVFNVLPCCIIAFLLPQSNLYYYIYLVILPNRASSVDGPVPTRAPARAIFLSRPLFQLLFP